MSFISWTQNNFIKCTARYSAANGHGFGRCIGEGAKDFRGDGGGSGFISCYSNKCCGGGFGGACGSGTDFAIGFGDGRY